MTFTMILSHTPIWVFLILALGLFLGVRGFFTRPVKLATIFILPVVFIYLSVSGLLSIGFSRPMVDGVYGLGLALGLVLGWYFLTPAPLAVNKAKATLTVKGSAMVIILFFLIFGVKYFFGVSQAIDPVLAMNPAVLLIVFGLSSISTGIAIGRNLRLFKHFRDAGDDYGQAGENLAEAEK